MLGKQSIHLQALRDIHAHRKALNKKSDKEACSSLSFQTRDDIITLNQPSRNLGKDRQKYSLNPGKK